MDPVLLMGVALGLRHGTDPDHLAAIDGLTRLRPNRANGVFFALGHGLTVILLAVGIGRVIAGHLSAVGPWTLIVIGTLNLWRMVRGRTKAVVITKPIVLQPFVLGVMLAAGFETASQLSALLLAGSSNLGSYVSLSPPAWHWSMDWMDFWRHLRNVLPQPVEVTRLLPQECLALS